MHCRKRLLDDRHERVGGADAKRRARLADDQNSRRRNVAPAQLVDQLEPAPARHFLVDHVALAGEEFGRAQRLRAINAVQRRSGRGGRARIARPYRVVLATTARSFAAIRISVRPALLTWHSSRRNERDVEGALGG